MGSKSASSRARFPVPREFVHAFQTPDQPRIEELLSRWRLYLSDLPKRNLTASGYFILTGFETALDSGHIILASLSEALGTLLPQDADGTLIREVRDRGMQMTGGGRYSDSRHGGSFHTDGPQAAFPAPEYFALLCVRQAPVGGDLILIRVEDVLRHLDRQQLDVLGGTFYFDRRAGIVQPPVAHPIVTGPDGDRVMRYLREYITLGHAYPGIPGLTSDQTDALDALDAVLNREDLQVKDRLLPGELVVVNNLTMCHGRTEFQDGASRDGRLMLRTWIRADID